MKRIVSIITIVASAAIALASCTRIECDCNHSGQQQQQSGLEMARFDYIIKANQWQAYTDEYGFNGYYMVKLNLPQLTSSVMKDGVALAYVLNGDGGQMLLPCSTHMEAVEVDPSDPTGETKYKVYWTQTIDVEFQEGCCFLAFTSTDHMLGDGYAPGDMSIRIVLLWK